MSNHADTWTIMRKLLSAQARLDMQDKHMFLLEETLSSLEAWLDMKMQQVTKYKIGAGAITWEFKNHRHIAWTIEYYFANAEGIIPCNQNLVPIIKTAYSYHEINEKIKDNPALYVVKPNAPSNSFRKKISVLVDGDYFPLLREAYVDKKMKTGLKEVVEAMRADPHNPKFAAVREALGLSAPNVVLLSKKD
jgi:hypothetical protein